jgi:hypothetical protein
MLTAAQAEALAQQRMQDYVNACGCQSHEDVANVLMKLASMCGLGMCAVVGHDEAVARMQGTTDYIAAAQAGVNYRAERAN